MTEFLIQVLWQTWNIFKQASVFLLFGFLIAGVLAVVVPEKTLARLFRVGKLKSVLWASTIGAPLPLCSCGVVPAALALRRQGANPGATVAFLIATPADRSSRRSSRGAAGRVSVEGRRRSHSPTGAAGGCWLAAE